MIEKYREREFLEPGYVSVWVGSFEDEPKLNDYLDGRFRQDFQFCVDDNPYSEFVVEPRTIAIRSLLEGFSYAAGFLSSVCDSARQLNVSYASTAVLFYDRRYVLDNGCNTTSSKLIFLGAFPYHRPKLWQQEASKDFTREMHKNRPSGGAEFWEVLERVDVGRLRQFIEEGYDLDACNEQDETALLYAVKNGDIGLASFFIKHGASLDQGNSVGYTPLMMAACLENVELVGLLLSRGASVENTSETYTRSPLHWATHHPPRSQSAVAKVTKKLLEYGADVNARDQYGQTPLMGCAWFGITEAALVLLEAGADPKLRDDEGRDAFQLAGQRNHFAFADILRGRRYP